MAALAWAGELLDPNSDFNREAWVEAMIRENAGIVNESAEAYSGGELRGISEATEERSEDVSRSIWHDEVHHISDGRDAILVKNDDGSYKLGMEVNGDRAYIADNMSYDAAMDLIAKAKEQAAEETRGAEATAKYSFGGTMAVTADLNRLSVAKEMLENGIDPEAVRRETGWFKGCDGKWRFEIDDSDMKLVGETKFNRHEDDGEVYYTAKLVDVLKHSELFKAYPELQDYTIIVQKTEPGVQGTSFAKNKQIVLAKELFEKITPEYAEHLKGGAEILQIERSPEYKEYESIYERDSDDAEAWLAEEKLAREKFFSSEIGKRYYKLKWGKFNGLKYEPGWSDQAKAVLLHELQHAVQYIEGFAQGSNNYYWRMRIKNGYEADKTPDKLYRNTAGEIEARDVSERAELSAEERKQKRPDIDRSDVVFTEDHDRSYSIVEPFVDSNGTTFENAVLLDTKFFDGLSPRNWGQKLRIWVNNRANTSPAILPISDENGNVVMLQFAKTNERVTKDGKSNHRVLDEFPLASDNISKLAVVHIDEIVSVSKENLPYYTTEHKHQWLDLNGWLHRSATVINAKNGVIYDLTLDIAKAADGRTILFATHGNIKRVGNVKVNSLKIKGSWQNSNSNDIIPHDSNSVKRKSKYSVGEDYAAERSASITMNDVDNLRSIPRKSINSFTSEEIKKTEPWARKFYAELGTKSPFFRAWFGDWRAYDQIPVVPVTKTGDTRGSTVNKDTGWNINISRQIHKETTHQSSKSVKNAVKYLPYINEITQNAILFDTVMSDKDNDLSLMFHSMYAYTESMGYPAILKLRVEELINEKDGSPIRRDYILQEITEEPIPKRNRLSTPNRNGTDSSILSIADLHELVKTYDEDFSPKAVNSLMLNDDGTPKVFYHGTSTENGDFTVFDYSKATKRGGLGLKALGKGNYFTSKELDGSERYGGRIIPAYLNIKNPFVYDGGKSIFEQFEQAHDIKAKDTNELQQTMRDVGFDGVIKETNGEILAVAFDPEQIKSATDNIGTFDGGNPDIRYSVGEDGEGIDASEGGNGLEATKGDGEKPREQLTDAKAQDEARKYLKDFDLLDAETKLAVVGFLKSAEGTQADVKTRRAVSEIIANSVYGLDVRFSDSSRGNRGVHYDSDNGGELILIDRELLLFLSVIGVFSVFAEIVSVN